MAQKPETVFSARLHDKKKWNVDIYFEKMNNPFRKATPDFFYEGPKACLWSEHKHILKPWTNDKSAGEICTSTSWPAQRRWLDRAHNHNQNTCIIIGVGSGRALRAYFLKHPFTFSFEGNKLLELSEIRTLIENIVL